MIANALLRIVTHKGAHFMTPFLERLVHGLVYPAVLGASIVEATIKIRDLYAPIPWVLVILLFTVDYALTGSETSAKAPRGNVLTALADLFSAAAFVGTYLVSAAWDGTRPFSDQELKQLVLVIFGFHFALICWYVFRWFTQDAAGLSGESLSRYSDFLRTNFIVVGMQSALIGLVGALVLWSCIGPHVGFYVMMLFAYTGLFIRNWRDYRQGPWS
jgi:hypothetical protein